MAAFHRRPILAVVVICYIIFSASLLANVAEGKHSTNTEMKQSSAAKNKGQSPLLVVVKGKSKKSIKKKNKSQSSPLTKSSSLVVAVAFLTSFSFIL